MLTKTKNQAGGVQARNPDSCVICSELWQKIVVLRKLISTETSNWSVIFFLKNIYLSDIVLRYYCTLCCKPANLNLSSNRKTVIHSFFPFIFESQSQTKSFFFSQKVTKESHSSTKSDTQRPDAPLRRYSLCPKWLVVLVFLNT